MAYAEYADVEARLGFSLETAEAQSVTMFLQDLSLMIDNEIEQVGKNPDDFSEDLLRMFTSRKGVDFYLYSERNNGASSISETVGDVSRSVSYNNNGSSNGLFLSEKDKRFLGIIGKGGFVNWTLTDGKRGC